VKTDTPKETSTMSPNACLAALFASLTLFGAAGTASAQHITVRGPGVRVGFGGPRVRVGFGGPRVVVRPARVFVPPRVVIAPPPRVVVAPPPRVVVAPPPPPAVYVSTPPVYVAPPPPAYVEPTPAVAPMCEADFAGLLAALADEGFDANRLTVLGTAAGANYFVAAQVVSVLDHFSFSSSRLQALQILAPHLVDHGQDHLIVASFTFSSDKEAARRILGH
jgi:hypothetical protein